MNTKSMRYVLIITFLVLQGLDVLTTNRALVRGGSEINPLEVLSMSALGGAWWAPKLLLMIVCALFLARRPTWWTASAVIFMAVIVVNNVLTV